MPEKDLGGFVITKITLASGELGVGAAEGKAPRIYEHVKAVLPSGKQTKSEA